MNYEENATKFRVKFIGIEVNTEKIVRTEKILGEVLRAKIVEILKIF